MFLVLTYVRNSEMSSAVFTVQKGYNFPVVEVTVTVVAEEEIVLVVAAVMAVAWRAEEEEEEEEEVVGVLYAGRAHDI